MPTFDGMKKNTKYIYLFSLLSFGLGVCGTLVLKPFYDGAVTDQNTQPQKSFLVDDQTSYINSSDNISVDEFINSLSNTSDRLNFIRNLAQFDDKQISFDLLNQIIAKTPHDEFYSKTLIPVITAEQIRQNGYDQVFQQVLQLDKNLHREPLINLFRLWALETPADALTYLSKNAQDLDFYKELEQLVIKTWGSNSPQHLLENIKNIPTMLRPTAEMRAFSSVAQDDPREAIKMLPNFSGSSFESALLYNLMLTWAETEPIVAFDWLHNVEIPPRKKTKAFKQVLDVIALNDSDKAFTLAKKLAHEGYGENIVVDVINTVAQNNPALAENMAQDISSVAAFVAVSRACVEKKNWNKVLSIADHVPLQSKQTYWDHVIEYWGINNPETLFHQMDKLPTTASSKAALQVLIHNRYYRFLNKNDFEHAQLFLNDTDRSIYEQVYFEPHQTTLVIPNAHGVSMTYSMDDVLSIIHRDLRKKPSVFP